MRLVLQALDRTFPLNDKSSLSIGSDPACGVYLPSSRQTERFAEIKTDSTLAWLIKAAGSQHSIHHNGRRIDSLTMLRAGDDLHFDDITVHVKSEFAPTLDKTSGQQAINFSDRILIRVASGAETGKGHALVNSLCIGRSSISEICVDDPALAERQILIQRQGNDVLVKNLSPALEMRIDGWACNEAILKAGSQLNIEQHRFVLDCPCLDLAKTDVLLPVDTPSDTVEINGALNESAAKTTLFSRSQWILLGSAVLIAILLVILLTIPS